MPLLGLYAPGLRMGGGEVQSVVPVADFVGSPILGNVPLAVQFTDLSTNTPTSWLWDFGDGVTSTLQNPSHVYQNAGSYTVSLTATNASGSNAKTKPAYITVAKPVPPAQNRPREGTGGRRVKRAAERNRIAKRRKEIYLATMLLLLDED